MGRVIRVSAALLLVSACSDPSIDPGYWETNVRIEGGSRPAANRRESVCIDGEDDGAERLTVILRLVEESVTGTWQNCELKHSSYRGGNISARAICRGRTTVYPQETVSEVTLDGSFAASRLQGRFSVDEGGHFPRTGSGTMTSRRIGECP
jgi:hypothetical protein